MQWISAHPYIAALCATGLMILGGVWIVQKERAVSPSNTPTPWGSSDLGILDSTPYTPNQNSGKVPGRIQPVQNNAPYTYIPPVIFDEGGTEKSAFDLNNFISKLTQGNQSTSATQNTVNTDITTSGAYDFIPSGLISTTSVQQTLTSSQQIIYNYANNVGSYIQLFEQQYPTASTILRDQAEDRSNPQKAAAVENFARALEGVGHDLQNNTGGIPEGIAFAHAALAKSYIEIGKNLALVPKATNDRDFLTAIEAYNASADTFVKNYVALATLLGAYGVTFSSSDPGSVFTFASSGL